jgi:acyl transferase domain-containing protein
MLALLIQDCLHCAAGMLAPDGRCKTLDAAADGYVRAEAAGLLLLQAVDGSRGSSNAVLGLLGVVLGSAVNQDGRSSALTAPNGPAQQAVIARALAAAGMEAHQVMIAVSLTFTAPTKLGLHQLDVHGFL